MGHVVIAEIDLRTGVEWVEIVHRHPDLVAAILDDALPNHITLFDLAVDPPALWEEQRERIGLPR